MFSLLKSIFKKPDVTPKTPAAMLAEKLGLTMIRNGLSPHSAPINELLRHLTPVVRAWLIEHGFDPNVETKQFPQSVAEFMAFRVPAVLVRSTVAPWWQDKALAMRLMEEAIVELLASEGLDVANRNSPSAATAC